MGFFSRLGKALAGNEQTDAPAQAQARPRPTKRVGGSIGHFGLEQWWFEELSEADRQLIRARYQPMGMPANHDSLTGGGTIYSSQTTASWLITLAGWFKPAEPQEADLILRIAEKAWQVKDVLAPSRGAEATFSRHLALGGLSETYYRFRENPAYLERSLEAARLQIAMQKDAAKAWKQQEINLARRTGSPAPKDIILPSHKGYKRLAIVLEQNKQYEEAIALVREAKTAGWSGDWDKRIERMKKKLNK